FYTEVGGLDVVYQDEHVVYLRAGLANYDYSLVLVRDAEASFSHGSFELASLQDLEQTLERLKARNITPIHDVNLPWKRSFFLRDPDGLLSEWYITLDGDRVLDRCHSLPLWAQV
ncbi:VOC family protein, partial [Alcaligenes pakistanensis]